MGLEEDLQSIFKFTGMGTGTDVSKLLNRLVVNTQLNTLRQMRNMIDQQLKIIGKQAGTDKTEDEPTAYDILGVKETDTREVIDKAYKKKASVAHPDQGGSHEKMVLVNAAYEAIRQFRGWSK